MEFTIQKRVLHIIYKNVEDIPSYLIEIADKYEGHVRNRIGFNFPSSFASSCQALKKYKCDYVIVYRKSDILTKKHELYHAKYFMDKDHKRQVQEKWNSLDEKYKKNVLNLLQKMNYPDNMDILLDEFQAYYFTEKKNFFGKEIL